MKNLDKFFQESKPVLEYEIKGKVIVGDVSTLAVLKAGGLYQKQDMLNDEAKMTQAMFEIIFGKENADYLISNLDLEGFSTVAEDVINAINGTKDKSEAAKKQTQK